MKNVQADLQTILLVTGTKKYSDFESFPETLLCSLKVTSPQQDAQRDFFLFGILMNLLGKQIAF